MATRALTLRVHLLGQNLKKKKKKKNVFWGAKQNCYADCPLIRSNTVYSDQIRETQTTCKTDGRLRSGNCSGALKLNRHTVVRSYSFNIKTRIIQ